MNIFEWLLATLVNRYSGNMLYHSDGSRTAFSSRYDRMVYLPSYTRRVTFPTYCEKTDFVYLKSSDLENLYWEEKEDKKILSDKWKRTDKLTQKELVDLKNKLKEYIEIRGQFSSPKIGMR